MKVVNVYKPDVLKISTWSEKNLWSEMDWQNFQQGDSKQQLVVVSSEAMLLRPPYTSLKAIYTIFSSLPDTEFIPMLLYDQCKYYIYECE